MPIGNFDYSGPAAEFLNLGNIASLVNRPLEFDPVAMKIVNDAEANGLLELPYRKGWEFVRSSHQTSLA